jgi:hypothetical protein
MTKPWFKREPELAERIRRDLEARYPDLRFVEEGEAAFVRGSFPIVHEGYVLDRYQVEVEFPRDYPLALPHVRETGGRIPHILDRHVLSDGAACLFVEEDWLLAIGGESSFLEFLDGPVRNFLLGQSLVEAGKPWPFGERSHGIQGLLEAYGEWFRMQDETVIARYLDYLSREEVKGHWECPCGSGIRLRKCHAEQVYDLRRRVPRWLAMRALHRLKYAQRVRQESLVRNHP